MYSLSTLLFGCNALYIFIVFLGFLFTSFNSLSFHCIIPPPYLNTAIAHAFIAATLFFSHLVLILGSIKAFAYTLLLFSLSFYFLFPCLHGKNSTFSHLKFHPNISTIDIDSSHKGIYLFLTLSKQLQIIHEQHVI